MGIVDRNKKKALGKLKTARKGGPLATLRQLATGIIELPRIATDTAAGGLAALEKLSPSNDIARPDFADTRAMRRAVEGPLPPDERPLAPRPLNTSPLARTARMGTRRSYGAAGNAALGVKEMGDKLTRLGEGLTGAGAPDGLEERIARSPLSAPITIAESLFNDLPSVGGDVSSPEHSEMDTLRRSITGPSDIKDADMLPPSKAIAEAAVGPVASTGDEMDTLLAVGAFSLASAFLPGVIGRLKIGGKALPKLDAVEDAHPDTLGFSNRIDLARTYDDVHAGLLRASARAGMDAAAIQRVKDKFDLHTRAAASALGDSAIENGRLTTGTLGFNVGTSLAQLSKADAPHVRRYLELHDAVDDLGIPRDLRVNTQNVKSLRQYQNRLNAAIQKGMQSVTRRRSDVRGITEQGALTEINALEAAHPELRGIRQAYKENLKELRRFTNQGEYATLSSRDKLLLDVTRPNEVPFAKGERVTGDAVTRGSPFADLADVMRKHIRDRLDNEAKGTYIDELRRVNPRFAVRVNKRQREDNPHWERTMVKVYRRGKAEYYTTDPLVADVMRFDPYHMTSIDPGVTTRRIFEMTTTGALAPWFAVTSAIRSYRIGKMTAPDGMRSPTIAGTVMAIPHVLRPQLAKAIGESLHRGSNGWLSKVFGSANMDAVALNLTRYHDRSLFAQLEQHGNVNSSILARQTEEATSRLRKFAKADNSVFGKMINGYVALLDSIHSAPMVSFVRRNEAKHGLERSLLEARHMTGDPRMGGGFYTGRSLGTGRMIRSNRTGEDGIRGKIADSVTHTYGATHELGRRYVPWYNYTVQGMKRLGQAYLENPQRFVTRAWMYGAMPAAGLYFYNRALDKEWGKDPTGQSYSEYNMRGRSMWSQMMYDYVAIPGQPADQGVEIPRFHEMSMIQTMMQVALDHLLRESPFTQEEDFLSAAKNWLGVVLAPPMPPIMSLGLGIAGMNAPQSAFGGGDAYAPEREPFVNDQWPVSLETISRALGGGLASVVGDAVTAYTHDQNGVLSGINSALKEGGKSIVARSPIVRDMLGARFPRSSDTQVARRAFANEDLINNLGAYYKKWDLHEGEINTDPASKAGEAAVEKRIGDLGVVPITAAGAQVPDPTNPLYMMAIKQVYDEFQTDTSGEMQGWKTLWRRHGDLTALIKLMRGIDAGNLSSWQKEVTAGKNKELIDYAKSHNVDYTDPIAMRNWMVGERGRLQLEMNKYVEEAESHITDAVKAFKEKNMYNLDPREGGFSPAQLNLFLALHLLNKRRAEAGQPPIDPMSLPDKVKLKDLKPYG